jgi:queuine tRNA-ribosyltransferase
VLLTETNLGYYQELMRGMRAAIAAGRFEDFRRSSVEGWREGDLPLHA